MKYIFLAALLSLPTAFAAADVPNRNLSLKTSLRGLCERSATFQKAVIRRLYVKKCEEVTAARIGALKVLRLNPGPGIDVSQLASDDFEGFESLTILEIDNNGDGRITPELLQGMPSLKELTLNNFPGMTEFPEGLFRNLPELEEVTLYNFIGVRSIASGFLEGPLSLREFQMNGLPLVNALPAGLFQSQPSLERIDISDSGLPRFQSDLLRNLAKLTTVRLYIGNFTPKPVPMSPTELPLDIFRDLPSLANISLVNLVIRPGTFAGSDSVRSLNLSASKIVPGSLAGLRQLQTLDFWGGSLEAGYFQGVENLQSLSIVHSKLGDLPPRVFAELGSLKTLSFLIAGITSFSNGEALAGLRGLESFEILGNKTGVQLLTPGMFEHSPGLRKIKIRESGLTVLPVGAFRGMPELKLLDLVGHKFTNVDPQAFSPMNLVRSTMVYFDGKAPDRDTQEQILALHGNRIAFDCGEFTLFRGWQYCPL